MKYFIVNFTLVMAFALGLMSCSSTKPMTRYIHETASQVGDVKKFQYYVSRNIVLTKQNATQISGQIAVSGKIEALKSKNIIQITSTTMGELLKMETDDDGNLIYYVAFEKDNDNYIRFKQDISRKNEPFYLVCDYNHSVRYGDEIYHVEWNTDALKASRKKAVKDNMMDKMKGKLKGVTVNEKDDPYLLVRMNIKIKEKENYRKASGRVVAQ